MAPLPVLFRQPCHDWNMWNMWSTWTREKWSEWVVRESHPVYSYTAWLTWRHWAEVTVTQVRNIQVWTSRYIITGTQHDWHEDSGQRLQSHRWEIYRCEHPGTELQVHSMTDMKTQGRGYSHTGEKYTGVSIQVQMYSYTAWVMWRHWAEATVIQVRNIQVWASMYRCTATQHDWHEDTGQRLQSHRWEIYRCEYPGTDVQLHSMSDVKTLGRGYSHTGEKYTGVSIQVQMYSYTA